MQQHGFGVRCLCRRYDFLRDCSASVFGLTHFLEAYRTVVLRRALANVDRSKKQTFAFVCGTTDWEDQTSILQLYPDYLLLAGTCMLKELLDTLDRKIMRNVPDKIWNTHNISPMEISILVLIGGVRKTLQVLAEPDIECRKHALRRFIRRLHPRVGRDWKKNWVDLKLPPDIVAQLDKLRHAKIGVPPLKVLWLEPALKVLIKSNAIREDQFRW